MSTSPAQGVPANGHEKYWLDLDEQLKRRSLLGLDDAFTSQLLMDNEFISLGNWCAVACGLQAIGVKVKAYPFDWCRSPMDGVIHCLETEFQDFLTYTKVEDFQGRPAYHGALWGGSFWHHDLKDEGVRHDVLRRIQRLLGHGHEVASKPLVFVRGVNSLRELCLIQQLRLSLHKAFPNIRHRLLVLIDNQPVARCAHLPAEHGSDLLLYCVSKSAMQVPWSMQQSGEAYAEAMAFAIRYWAGLVDPHMKVEAFASMPKFTSSCSPFACTSTEVALFDPCKEFFGHILKKDMQADMKDALQANASLDEDPIRQTHGSNSHSYGASQHYQATFAFKEVEVSKPSCVKAVEFIMPHNADQGDIVEFPAFGHTIKVRLSEACAQGECLRAYCRDGEFSVMKMASKRTMAGG